MTILEKIESWSPRWLLGDNSEGFVGAVLSIVGDAVFDTLTEAHLMARLLEPTSPPDALPLASRERRMPRYPGETLTAHRFRLWDAWSAYEFGASKKAIEDQLRQAGFPGKVIYSGPYWEENYYSQFWVYFPPGSHTITAPAPKWGSFAYGDGTTYGPVGITFAQLEALKDLVKKWKDSQWICRAMVFEISGWLYGTGHKWGEPGLKWGGKSAVVRMK